MSSQRFYDFTVSHTVSATSVAVDVPDDDELMGQGFSTSEAREARRLEVAREALTENIHFAYRVAKMGGASLTLTSIKEGEDWREGVKR